MTYQRRQLFHILHKPDPSNKIAKRVGIALALLILANAIALAVESLPRLSANWHLGLKSFEALSTLLFAVEYAMRIWVCVEQKHLQHPIKGRLRYMLQPLLLLDLLVIVTYFLPIDLRFLRILRIVRLLPVLGLHKLSDALREIAAALQRRAQLLIASLVLMVIAIYFSAALLYQIEHQAQPEIFTSIPETLWWSVVSLTTVGYGDMAPITSLGKLFAAGILFFGIGIFALPTAIFTAAIIDASSFSAEKHHQADAAEKRHQQPKDQT